MNSFDKGMMFGVVLTALLLTAIGALMINDDKDYRNHLLEAACGRCDAVEQCGELVCVPGHGWLERKAP
jgi:hypothetical protein